MTFLEMLVIAVVICGVFLVLGVIENWLWERRQDRREQEARTEAGGFTDWLEDVPADFEWRRSA